MYSLVSASVLALDLARHPSGAAVADAVDRVLSLGPADLAALAEAADPSPARDAARARVLEHCATAPRLSGVMRGVSATVGEDLPGPATSQVLLDTLAETMLGGLADLLALLAREEPLDAPGAPAAGVQSALDAVAVAWAGRAQGVDLADLALLRGPWAQALSPVPAALPEDGYGDGGAALRALLEELSRTDAAAWTRVAEAHWSRQGGLRWSTAMHEACRAAVDAGRLVPAARAQLAAARAVRLSGVSTTPGASGAMMAVTAAVQAACVADLLDDDVARTLVEPWEAAARAA